MLRHLCNLMPTMAHSTRRGFRALISSHLRSAWQRFAKPRRGLSPLAICVTALLALHVVLRLPKPAAIVVRVLPARGRLLRAYAGRKWKKRKR